MFNTFYNSQKWSKRFLICTGENNFWGVSLQFLLLNKLKNKFCFSCNLINLFLKNCAHFRVTVQIFWGPATSENAALRHAILELGSYNNLAQHRMCSFLFFNITPPYCTNNRNMSESSLLWRPNWAWTGNIWDKENH